MTKSPAFSIRTAVMALAVFGFGDRSTGYVVENVVLHLGVASLVYALVWQLARRVWPATVAALLVAAGRGELEALPPLDAATLERPSQP